MLTDKIQPREKSQGSGNGWQKANSFGSGNSLNVNWNVGGLKVNNWYNRDNANYNLGALPRRSPPKLSFKKITSLENIFLSWKKFRKGKRKKKDAQEFERNLEDNLFKLCSELENRTYRHSHYTPFYITDPKRRHIHKAIVRDRVVHHAVYRVLYPIFDRSFIFDSYSCRIGKGTHRAVDRLEKFVRIVSKNYTRPCFALKCDIKKFFASVDQQILLSLIRKKVKDGFTLELVEEIIESFFTKMTKREREREYDALKNPKDGLPLGNLTSQLFANIYLSELDEFVKHKLKAKFYLRYSDDFIILGNEQDDLAGLIQPIKQFLGKKLKLFLHPDKIILRKLKQGIDFLGYVVLPYHRVLRTKTKRRMLRKINQKNLPSYLGLLQHCNFYKLKKELKLKSVEICNRIKGV